MFLMQHLIFPFVKRSVSPLQNLLTWSCSVFYSAFTVITWHMRGRDWVTVLRVTHVPISKSFVISLRWVRNIVTWVYLESTSRDNYMLIRKCYDGLLKFLIINQSRRVTRVRLMDSWTQVPVWQMFSPPRFPLGYPVFFIRHMIQM